MKMVGFPELDEEAKKRQKDGFRKCVEIGFKKLPKPIVNMDEVNKKHSDALKEYWANRRNHVTSSS